MRSRWVCALTGRHGEASEWFARARTVLEEQGARPLRARALLDRARTQFEDVGMSGWLRHAAQLATTLEARS